MLYDLCIIGGGPAGVAAGVYAARKKIITVLITEHFRNQSADSENIENWIGTISISGKKLASNFEKHVKNFANDIDIKEKEKVEALSKNTDGTFKIKTNKAEYSSKI
jgi:alkyl hydroperoxide reductase subunit F